MRKEKKGCNLCSYARSLRGRLSVKIAQAFRKNKMKITLFISLYILANCIIDCLGLCSPRTSRLVRRWFQAGGRSAAASTAREPAYKCRSTHTLPQAPAFSTQTPSAVIRLIVSPSICTKKSPTMRAVHTRHTEGNRLKEN